MPTHTGIRLNDQQLATLQVAMADYTQVAVAEAAGLTPIHLNYILRGRRPVSAEALKRIAFAVGLRAEIETVTTIDFSPI